MEEQIDALVTQVDTISNSLRMINESIRNLREISTKNKMEAKLRLALPVKEVIFEKAKSMYNYTYMEASNGNPIAKQYLKDHENAYHVAHKELQELREKLGIKEPAIAIGSF